MNRLVDVGISETTIARLRADLAASRATAGRLAKEVGEAIERREFFGVLVKTAADEYSELRASIGQPVDEPGASTHASAVIHGQWLVLGAKDRAKAQRARAFVDGLKRDGVVIPSTAPVRVLDGDDGREQDEPSEDLYVPNELSGDEQDELDRTAIGCATASTAQDDGLVSAMVAGIMPIVQRIADERWANMSKAERLAIVDKTFENPDPRFSADDVKLSWHETPAEMMAQVDHGTPDQTDGYHGGAAELAADDVLDDPRMDGEQWILPDDVSQAMIDAWPGLWESGGAFDIAIPASFVLRSIEYEPRPRARRRPLRFPHQSATTGAIESRYMTEEHFARCKWEWRSYAPNWKPRSDRPVDISKLSPDSMWRPVGWPDVELSADDLEANIDKSLRMPPDAGAKAAAEYDAAIEKYSPDMRDLVGRLGAVERRQSSLDTLVSIIEQLGARVVKLEYAKVRQSCGRCGNRFHPLGLSQGVCLGCHAAAGDGAEPEETPDAVLDGLVPIRADETNPGQWMTLLDDGEGVAWRRREPTFSRPVDGRIALVDKCRNEWLVKPDAIVYVEPQ